MMKPIMLEQIVKAYMSEAYPYFMCLLCACYVFVLCLLCAWFLFCIELNFFPTHNLMHVN